MQESVETLQAQLRQNVEDMQQFDTTFTEITQRETELKAKLADRDKEQQDLLKVPNTPFQLLTL